MTQSFGDPGMAGQDNANRTANVDLTANVSGYTSQMNQAAQSTGTLSRGVDELTNRMAGLNKWAGKKLFHFAAADFTALAVASADAATFEKQLSTLAATAAITGSSLGAIKGGIEAAFTKFPVARGQVVSLVEAITNLGVTSASQIGSLTQTFIKLGAATGEPMNQLASGLIQLSRLMGSTDAGQIGNYANALLTVSKNAGVSASGVLQFAQTIAPIARQAGIGEGAILGISAAFTKAGADGFVATNTFNSMLSDITSSIATGSPMLNKYANLIGATTEQFKRMDKTQAIVQIFDAISRQGPQAIALLNNLGIEGVRAQAAIAAITQSGNLQQSINQALNSQGDQKNLNKGADAAFNNLADSMANVRNQFTQFGTEIGTTFLGPMTAAANLAAAVAHHVTSLVHPFSALIGTLGVVAGGAAGMGAIALNAAGAIGAYALFRAAKNSKAVAAFKAGTTLGTGREDFSPGSAGGRALAGEMGTIESGAYLLGGGFRRGATAVGIDPLGRSPWRDPQVWRNAMVAGPIGASRMLSRMNEQFMRGEYGGTKDVPLPLMQRLNLWGRSLQGRTMLDVAAQEARPLASQLGRTTQATVGAGLGLFGHIARAGWALGGPTIMGALVGGATGVPGGSRMFNAARGSMPTGSVAAEFGGVKQAGMHLSESVKAIVKDTLPLRMGFTAVGTASKDLAVALARTGGTILGAGIGQTVSGVAKGVGYGISTIGALGGQLMRGLFSLPGFVGLMAGQALLSHQSSLNAKGATLEPFLNPIQRYNDLLGTTTANLATFGQGLSDNAQSLSRLSTMTIKQAEQFGNADLASAPKTPLNKVWESLSNVKNPIQLAQAILQSMPINSGGQLKLAEQDMAAAGLGKDQVNQVIAQYKAAGGPSPVSGLGAQNLIGVQGQAAAQAEGSSAFSGLTRNEVKMVGTAADVAGGAAAGAAVGSVIPGLGTAAGALVGGVGGFVYSIFGGSDAAANKFHVNPSEQSLLMNANILSGISSQQVSDTSTRGGSFADQRAYIAYMAGLGPQVSAIGQGGVFGERQSRAVATALGTITGGKPDDYFNSLNSQNLSADLSPAKQWAAVTRALANNEKGRQYLAKLSSEGVNTSDPRSAAQNLINLSNTTDGSDFNSQLMTYGRLGKFSARAGVIQSAIGADQGSVSAQYDASKALERVAEGGRKVTDGYAGAIARLTMFASRVGDATGAMGKLIDAATAEELSKQQNLQPYQSHTQNLLQAAHTYRQVAVQFNTAKAAGDDTTQAANNLATAKSNYDQLLASEQSYDAQIVLTVAQFHIQQIRAEQDYGHQKMLAQKQFQLQSEYSLHDFHLQETRANADHNRQLADQAATAAQSIYDPFQRIQAKYTESASTVIQLGVQQNQALAAQSANLRKLHREGLSTQAIRTLDLADPNNAAEAANLASSMTPQEAARLNRIEGQRGRLTKNLTQSPDNLAFSQSQREFRISLNRAATDFATAQRRAVRQETINLNEMAYQFGTQTKRAAKDLQMSARIISGSFDQVKAQAIAAVKTISDSAPGAAKIWENAFAKDNIIDLLGLNDPNALITAGTNAGKIIADGLKKSLDPRLIFENLVVGVHTPGFPTHHHHRRPPSGNPTGPGLIGGGNAAGGIATSATYGLFGEAGPEALIPLNGQGQDFMAALIVRALGQSVRMMGPSGSSSTSVDSSTNFNGAVTVISQDTRAFEREMKAKARLRKLTSPTRRG